MTMLIDREESIPFHKIFSSIKVLVTLLYEPYSIFIAGSFAQKEHMYSWGKAPVKAQFIKWQG